jgi:hypothetical protein
MRTKRGLDLDRIRIIFKRDSAFGDVKAIYGATKESGRRYLPVFTTEAKANQFLACAQNLGKQGLVSLRPPSDSVLLELLTRTQGEKVDDVAFDPMPGEKATLVAIQEVIDDVREAS